MSVVFQPPTPGLLKVAVYGAIPATNDGVYVYLRFTTTGKAGTGTPITISGFRLADGVDEIVTTNGFLQISRDTDQIPNRITTSSDLRAITKNPAANVRSPEERVLPETAHPLDNGGLRDSSKRNVKTQ